MTLQEWALTYARWGWPVFPCDPRSKEPLLPRDIDPETKKPIPGTGGLKKATTDADTIKAWWARWPKAMIALATGGKAGFFVVDIDAGKDDKTGEEFTRAQLLADLERECGPMPKTWAVATPRGGMHLYFRYPEGEKDAHSGRALGNRTGFIRRIDTRGEGGYVFAPPSLRADGRPYEWLVKPATDADRPAEAPAALLDCILHRGRWDDRVTLGEQAPDRPAKRRRRASAVVAAPAAALAEADEHVRHYAEAAFDAEMKALRDAADGTRNDALFHASIKMAQLVAAGALDHGVALQGLESVARTWPNFHKSQTTIESGWNKGLREPRDLSEVRAEGAARARRFGSARAWRDGDQPARPTDVPPASGPEDYGIPPTAVFAAAAAAPSSTVDALGGDESATFPSDETFRAGDGNDHSGGGDGEDDEVKRIALNLRLAFFPLTDLGNSERFRERNRGRLLHCPELGWLWWDGKRWSRDGADGRVRIAEHLCVRGIKDEAEALRHSGRDEIVGWKSPAAKPKPKKKLSHDDKVRIMAEALAGAAVLPETPDDADDETELKGEPIHYSDLLDRWARASEENRRLSKIADHGKAYLAVSPRELDADRFVFNVLNGTLRFGRRADGTIDIGFRAHDPADKITKLAPVRYDPKARCPRYDAFLAEMQPKPENRRFLHQWGGYGLTGDVGEQRLVFFWGKGRNGKSTLVDIWGLIAGDYGTSTPIETFLSHGQGKQGNQATPDLAMLKGVRFVRTSEPDKGSKLGEALIKLVTGGEPFPVRELHKPFFQLQPQFKLTISGNYRPKIIGTDEGIWRRVTLVPWTIILDKAKVDKQLGGKLATEASGVLNRLVAGVRDWLEHGLIIPEDVETATATYRRDSDPLGRFIDACVIADPGGQVQSSIMHAVFCAWCKANGEREWTNTGFSLAMSDRGFQSKKASATFWLNLKLTKSESDFVDSQGNALRVDSEKGGRRADDDDVVPF